MCSAKGRTVVPCQAFVPGGPLHPLGQLCPALRKVCGNKQRFFAFEKLHEVTKSLGRFAQLAAQRTADCYVLCESIAKVTQRTDLLVRARVEQSHATLRRRPLHK